MEISVNQQVELKKDLGMNTMIEMLEKNFLFHLNSSTQNV